MKVIKILIIALLLFGCSKDEIGNEPEISKAIVIETFEGVYFGTVAFKDMSENIFDANVVTIQIANLNGIYTVVGYPFKWTIDETGYGSVFADQRDDPIDPAPEGSYYYTDFFDTQINGNIMIYQRIHRDYDPDGVVTGGYQWEGELLKQ